MSNTIDSKVVEMKFDNSQFENGVKTSLGTLDKLKNSLKFADSTKGLENVSNAANKMNFSGLADGVATIQDRFSNLGIVGMTVLQNLTNSVVNMGKKWITAIPKQIVSGGIKRAMNLEKANFQLQGLLKDASKVEAVMKNVNTAVDGTAYGLDEAALVASQFAASGLEAGDEMEHALKAISGVAAMTSSSYGEIGDVFTRVAGQGRLMGENLNSLAARGLNAAATLKDYLNANDAVKQERMNAALATGKKAMAEIDWQADLTEADIREMVSAGVIDFQTFANAMDDAFSEHATKANETFSGALSNMKAALSRIGAKVATPMLVNLRDIFNSLRKVFNSLNEFLDPLINKINKTTKAITDLIVGFFEFGAVEGDTKHTGQAMKNIFDGLSNIFHALSRVIGTVKNAFKAIIPPITVETLVKATEAFKRLTSNVNNIDIDTILSLHNIGLGLASVLKIVKSLIKGVLTVLEPLAPLVGLVGKALVSLFGRLGKHVETLSNFLERTQLIQKASEKLASALGKVVEKIVSFGELKAVSGVLDFFESKIKSVWEWLRTLWDGLTNGGERVENRFAKLGEKIDELKEKFKGLSSVGDTVKTIFSTLGDLIKDVSKNIGDGLGRAFGGDNGLKSFLDVFNTGAIGALLLSFGRITDTLSIFAEGNGGTFLNNFMKSAFGGNLIRDAHLTLSTLKTDLAAMQGSIKAGAIQKIAIAVGILAASALVLSMIDPDRLSSALVGIGAMMGELAAMMGAMDKIGGKKSKLGKMALAMIGVSVAILILAGAMKKISEVDPEQVRTSLVAIGILMGELVAVSRIMEGHTKGLIKGGIGISIFALGIRLLVKPLKQLGEMPVDQLKQGLLAIGGLILEISGIMLAGKFGKFGVSTGLGIIALAAGIKILADIVKDLGNIPTDQLEQGLVAVAAALGEIALAVNLMKGSTTLAVGVGLVIIGAGLEIITNVIKKLGESDQTQVSSGLMNLAAALGILALALHLMEGTLLGSAALVIAAAAIAILTPAIMLLGQLNLEQVLNALIAMAGAFTILGVAAMVFSNPALLVGLLGLSGAIALLGVAALAAGAGIALFATGLATLAVSGVAGIAALGLVVTDLVKIIGDFVVGLAEQAPRIVGAILSMFMELLVQINEYAPDILEQVVTFVLNIMEMLIDKSPDFIDTGIRLIVALIDGLAQGIEDNRERIIEAFKHLLTAIIDFVLSIFGIEPGTGSEVFSKIGGSLIDGLKFGLSVITAPLAAIVTLGTKLVGKLKEWLPKVKEKGKQAMENLKEGIHNKIETVKNKVGDVVTGALEKIEKKKDEWRLKGLHAMQKFKEGLESITDKIKNGISGILDKVLGTTDSYHDSLYSSGAYVMRGFKNGMESLANEVYNVAGVIGANAVSTLNRTVEVESPSKATFRTGRFFDLGLINGMRALSGRVEDSAADVGENALNALSGYIDGINYGVGNGITATITPVIDSSSAITGFNALNSFFGTRPIDVAGNLEAQIQNGFESSLLHVDNGDVVNAIEEMLDEIAALGDRISRMQMVVDSGALVGQIAPDMDSALGRIAIRRNRG